MPTTPRPPAATPGADKFHEDGWTNEQMALFLTTVARTGMVSVACKAVERSEDSAYELRRSRHGRLFSVGWKAARLLARDVLEARLLELPPPEAETIKTPTGEVTRGRTFDKKFAMDVLNRLEQQAVDLRDGDMAMARSIADSFEEFIELVSRGGDEEALIEFLVAHPDPLEAQVEAMWKREEGAARAGRSV